MSTALRPSPIVPSVNYEKDGVQHGHLRLPYSRDDSAWGSVMIPICVVRNGSGPTALLTGANHGDEYEGPLALFDLARRLDPQDVSGTVIIVPAMNYPAFRSSTRTSPIDKGNMNRSFPGRPDGTVTQKIADYFSGNCCLAPISFSISIQAERHWISFPGAPPMSCPTRRRKPQPLPRWKLLPRRGR